MSQSQAVDEDFLKSTIVRGSQTVDINSLRISFYSPATHLSILENKILLELYYTALFFDNRTARSALIFVSSEKQHVDAIQESWGPFVDDTTGQVALALAPIFTGLEASFLRVSSRRPRYIAAIVKANKTYLFVRLHAHRGAYRSRSFADEIKGTLHIALNDVNPRHDR